MLGALAHAKWRGLLTAHTTIHGGGGYYIWTQLGDRIAAQCSAKDVDLLARQRYGVGVKEGGVFACPPPGGGGAMREEDRGGGGEGEVLGRCMRLCVAYYETEELLEGLDRLHLALEALAGQPARGRL